MSLKAAPVGGERTARSSRIAGPMRQVSSGNGVTALPSMAMTCASAPSMPTSITRVESRLSRRRRRSADAGTVRAKAAAPLTVRTVPKVPARLAPSDGAERQEGAIGRQAPILGGENDIVIERRRCIAIDDEEAGEPLPHLSRFVAMGMEEEGPGIGWRELIDVAAAGLDRLLGDVGHAIHGIGYADAMPMDAGMFSTADRW